MTPPDDHRKQHSQMCHPNNHESPGRWVVFYTYNFPIHLWDKTIPQAQLTLKLLRGSRINPELSTTSSSMANLISIPTQLAHARPTKRCTWSTNAHHAWYACPAMDHYRCYAFGSPSCDNQNRQPSRMAPTDAIPMSQ
jgi:hypothetical protein